MSNYSTAIHDLMLLNWTSSSAERSSNASGNLILSSR